MREPHSSLAALLFNLNTSAVSSISATINGSARLAERGSDEERYYRQVHLENNTFDGAVDTGAGLFGSTTAVAADGGAEGGEEEEERRGSGAGTADRFAAGDDVRVIVVGIRDVRIADWKGTVRDWVIASPEGQEAVVNGGP